MFSLLVVRSSPYMKTVNINSIKQVNDCNLHGSCVGGTCQCQTGYGGADCSIWDHVIYSGIEQTGHLNTFQWKYYHFTTTDDISTFTVYVNQTSSIGDIDLYVGENYYPDTIHSNFSDTSTNDRLSFSSSVNSISTWYFGLYGYWTADYSIVLYSSRNFCFLFFIFLFSLPSLSALLLSFPFPLFPSLSTFPFASLSLYSPPFPLSPSFPSFPFSPPLALSPCSFLFPFATSSLTLLPPPSTLCLSFSSPFHSPAFFSSFLPSFACKGSK